MDELAATRERGYAECAGELEGRLFGVSAPVLSSGDGRPLAVFGIWGFVDRVPVSRFAELGPIAVGAAAEITTIDEHLGQSWSASRVSLDNAAVRENRFT